MFRAQTWAICMVCSSVWKPARSKMVCSPLCTSACCPMSRIDVLTSRLLGIILAILLLSAVVGIIFQTDYIRRFEVPRQGKGANAF